MKKNHYSKFSKCFKLFQVKQLTIIQNYIFLLSIEFLGCYLNSVRVKGLFTRLNFWNLSFYPPQIFKNTLDYPLQTFKTSHFTPLK